MINKKFELVVWVLVQPISRDTPRQIGAALNVGWIEQLAAYAMDYDLNT